MVRESLQRVLVCISDSSVRLQPCNTNSHFGRFDPPRAVLGLTASLRLLTGYLTGWNSKTTHVYAPPYGFTPPTPPKRNSNRVVSEGVERGHNPVGVEKRFARYPRVARSSQPWAGGHNPFGIDCRREPTSHYASRWRHQLLGRALKRFP